MTVTLWNTLGASALGLMLLCAAGFDLASRRIPNPIVLLGSLAALSWAASPAGPGLVMSLLGGLVASITFLILHWQGWMGAGDVKLAGATGLYFNPSQAFNLCLTIFIAGGVIALLWRLQARDGLKARIPYGLAIGLGAAWYAWQHTVF